MILHAFADAPAPDLADRLEKFEAQFTYPLGPHRRFRISHGRDYARFFRAMGEAVCFAAERDGAIHGTLGAVIRTLVSPDGSPRATLYLGDLKVTPDGRAGQTLISLARAAVQWSAGRVDSAFSVVMDGTRATPDQYTGRLGIPPFRNIGKIVVLRLATRAVAANGLCDWESTAEAGHACYRQLSAGRFSAAGGSPKLRSEQDPIWLVERSHRACGRLEDTHLAKRLFSDDGCELRSAHLSDFAYRDAVAGAALIRAATHRAAVRGIPALFVAVAEGESELLRDWHGADVVRASATVFGSGLDQGHAWSINTAEI